MHLSWNIGKAFGKPRLQTATFIKRVFAHSLRDSEISTIERKMSLQNQRTKLNWIKELHYSNTIRHYPLHPSNPYPFS